MLRKVYSSNYVRHVTLLHKKIIIKCSVEVLLIGGLVYLPPETLSNGTYSKAYVAFYAGMMQRSFPIHVASTVSMFQSQFQSHPGWNHVTMALLIGLYVQLCLTYHLQYFQKQIVTSFFINILNIHNIFICYGLQLYYLNILYTDT